MDSDGISVECLTVGQLRTNAYLVSDRKTGSVCVIDPGDDAEYIAGHVTRTGLNPVGILLTHGHFDHCLAAFELEESFGIPVYLKMEDAFLVKRMRETATRYLGYEVIEPPPRVDRWLTDETRISVGPMEIEVIACPGHTPGGVTYRIGNCLFTGDTLFAEGLIGDWRHTYSVKEDVLASVARLLDFPETMRVYPGHGAETTVGQERIFRDCEKRGILKGQ